MTRPVQNPIHTTATREHLLPRSRGGTGKFIIIVCWDCNRSKADTPLDSWLALLRFRDDPRAYYVDKWMKENWRVVTELRGLEKAARLADQQRKGVGQWTGTGKM